MNENNTHVLVIDDEPQICKLLRLSLKVHGYGVQETSTGKEGIAMAALRKPDIIIVDLGLPDMDGKEVVTKIREWSDVPIIILTARGQEQEKIDALDVGADDYLTKPFGVGELMARMRVALRRAAHSESDPIINCGDLVINLAERRVIVAGQEIKLTPTEYDILKLLAQHIGKVLTHKQLLKAVWGNTNEEDNHYIRVYIAQIRRKIEGDSAQHKYIFTEPGIGYRLMPNR